MGKNKLNSFRDLGVWQKSAVGGLIKSLNSKFYILNPNSGFTVVELLVAIGLFSVVASIAMGGLVAAMRTQRQIAALIAAQNNVSFALEQIARDVRTGSEFCVSPNTSPCPPGELDFTNAMGQAVVYRVSAGKIEKGVADAFQPITGDNASVQYLSFELIGNSEGDGYPPRITITVGISSPTSTGGISSIVSRIQTTVSARQLDT